ncbi:MAG: hypothetical protein LBS74_08950 [Oscillospiraceae bacterium]|jgi:hypothetical protein|nr:hypothetical protein [Oscillospiraceae bacterium]
MIRIVILGKKGDDSIQQALLRALGKHYCIESFSANGLIRTGGENPDLIIYDTESVARIDDTDTILIFKRNFESAESITFSPSCIAVLEESNYSAIALMLKKPNVAICCGMSSRNSLSLASNDIGSAVVSLQRELTSFKGTTIDVGDIPVNVTRLEDQYTLMAVTAVLLLIDAPTKNRYTI